MTAPRTDWAAVLGEHVGSTTERYDVYDRAYHPFICECGEYDQFDGTQEGHRAHLAAVIAARVAEERGTVLESAADDMLTHRDMTTLRATQLGYENASRLLRRAAALERGGA